MWKPTGWVALVTLLASVALALFGPSGSRFHVVAMAGALCSFGVVMWTHARRSWLRMGPVTAASALMILMAVAAPPRESADVWSFVMYGRVEVVHHANPYADPPDDFPLDRWLRLVRPVWRATPSLYGPAFNLAAGAVVVAARGSAAAARMWFQALAGLGVAGSMWVVARRGRDPAAVGMLGLNPFVTVGVINGGHADALVGLAVLAGVLLVLSGSWGWAAASFAAGMLVKIPALLPVAVAAAAAWRLRGFRHGAALGGVAAGAGLAGYLAFGGTASLDALRRMATIATSFTAWHLLGVAARDHPGWSGPLPAWVPFVVVVAAAAAVAGAFIDSGRFVDAVGAATLVYLAGSLYVLPWYVMWTLPVLALRWRSPLMWLAMGQATLVYAVYAMGLPPALGGIGARAFASDVVAVAQTVLFLAMVAWAAWIVWVSRRGKLAAPAAVEVTA